MKEKNSSNSSFLKNVTNNRSTIFGLLFFIIIIFISLFLSTTSGQLPEPAQEFDQVSHQEDILFQENRIETGKTIQKTLQSDPCIEDIVRGLPQEYWRCYTPEPVGTESDFQFNSNLRTEEAVKSPSPTITPRVSENIPPSGNQVVIETINWDEAFQYAGELVVICGPVVDSYFAASSNGQPTFLNIGKEYPDPDRFTALIWGRNLEAFPFDPDVYYKGKTVCIKGVIEEYEGIFEVEVRRPDQIEIK